MHSTRLIRAMAFAAILASLAGQPWRSTAAAARAGVPPATTHGRSGAEIPDTPVGSQLRWVLEQLDGGAATLDEAELNTRFAPAFLAGFPPAQLLRLLRDSALEHGPIRVTGIAGPATDTALIALAATRAGERVAIYLDVESAHPHRITSLEVSEPPAPPASDVATPGPHTGAFDTGGRRLFLTCAGEGSPTVVLEAGAGAGAAAWTAVQPALARLTRVCSYDRANVPGGASDPAPKPRSAADVVDDLHALLTAAGVPSPYVLAGHSLGGLYARLYASTHPDDVVGLVLVDAAHEDQEERLAGLLGSPMPAATAGEVGLAPFVERVGDEQVDFQASAAQVRAARAAAPLRPVPLIVLAHGLAADPAPGTPPELVEAQEHLWRDLQADLAGLVPGGRLIIAERSGHIIQEEQPELVVEALREVVDAVRRATPTAGRRK